MNFTFLTRPGILVFLGFAALLCTSPVHLSLWQLRDNRLQSIAWQQAYPVVSSIQSAEVEMKLEKGSFSLNSPLENWKSPNTWQVQQALWADLNHDGIPEATLLVRRPFEPWPVDRLLPNGGRIQSHQDAEGMSSHIILIGWKKDHWGEVWAGSALARPVQQFQVTDLNSDGHQELVALEGLYNTGNPAMAASLAVWQWNGFGFDLVSRLEMPARQFVILKTIQNQQIILVN